MKKSWLALIFGSALFLAACGGNDEGTNDNNNNNAGNNNTTTEQSTGTDQGTTETASADGEAIVKESCVTCHGGDLQGMGNTPALADVGSRLSEDEILNVILKGRNGMPAGLLQGEDAEAAAAWLATQK